MPASTKTIVLLPGFMLDDALWDDFVPHLPRDWNVLPIALPQGRTVLEVAQAVAAGLAGPAVVVGFSMGGYVGRSLAVAYPQLVQALVLVATSGRRERPAARFSAAGDPGSFAGLSRRAIQGALSRQRADDQVLVERVRAMGVRLGGEAFAWQSALDRTDVPLQEIACPTLVVAARQDRLRSIDEARELAGAIPGAHLEIIEDAGHLIPLEAPALLAGMLVEWLRDRAH